MRHCSSAGASSVLPSRHPRSPCQASALRAQGDEARRLVWDVKREMLAEQERHVKELLQVFEPGTPKVSADTKP